MKRIMAIMLCVSVFGMGFSGCATFPTNWDALVEKLCPNYLQYRDSILESRSMLQKVVDLLVGIPELANEPIILAGLVVILSSITTIIDLAEKKCLTETDVIQAQVIAKKTMENKSVKLAMARAKQLKVF